MLVPIQTSGTRPPLFMVHGVHGDIASSVTLARVLGPDFPLYGIAADGTDGRQPVLDNMADMVRSYVDQVCTARPTGPVRIAGICEGGWAAIELTRAVQRAGREVRPVVLLDPPAIPPGYNSQNRSVNPSHPQIAERLYQSVRHYLLTHAENAKNSWPFDASDPKQLHTAVLAGLGSVVAFSRHLPKPYSAPAVLILSAQRAPRFFDPQTPGGRLFRGPRLVFVVPWQHDTFYTEGRNDVAYFLKYLLVESLNWESVAGPPDQSDQLMAMASPS
jgi:thioesterase domain-containing protein